MKKLSFLKFFAVITFIGFGFVSCNQENLSQNETENEIEVSITCGGDFEVSGMEPLSRIGESPSDLLLIQVLKYSPETEEALAYAQGLFSSKDNISIKLKKDEQYIFYSSLIVDGVDRLPNNDGHYLSPFNAEITNSFVYTSNINIDASLYGIIYLPYNENFIYPYPYTDFDRYICRTQYTADSQSTIELYMHRTSFGLDIITENFTEGEIGISLSPFDGYLEYPITTITYPQAEASVIYSFYDLMGFMNYDNPSAYSENVFVNIYSISYNDNGLPDYQLLGGQQINFVSNVKQTLKVRLSDSSSKVSIATESQVMTDWDNSSVFEGGN